MPESLELDPSLFTIEALRRPGQAAQQLAEGDMESAYRALVRPSSMSPKERDELLREYGVDKSPWAPVFNMLTNPLLIGALLLAHKFPIPSARNIFKLSEQVGTLESRMPILGRLASMQGLFRGTPVPDIFAGIARQTTNFETKWGGRMGDVLRGFRQAIGRDPSAKEQALVSAWLDGLHLPLRGWQGKNGVIQVGKGATSAMLEPVGTLIPDLELHMTAPVKRLARNIRGILDEMWGETLGNPSAQDRLRRALSMAQKSPDIPIPQILEELGPVALEQPSLAVRFLHNYFPHRMERSEEWWRRLVAQITTKGDKTTSREALQKVKSWHGPEAKLRGFGMLPSSKDLQVLGDIIDPAAAGRLDAIKKAQLLNHARTEGKMLETTIQRLAKQPLERLRKEYTAFLAPGELPKWEQALAAETPEYSLKLQPVLNEYRHSLGSTSAWTLQETTLPLTHGSEFAGMSNGEALLNQYQKATELGAAGHVPAQMRAEMLRNTYIPMAAGRGATKQLLRAQAWEQGMWRLSFELEKPGYQKVLGSKLTTTLQESMRASRGAFSLGAMSRKAAGYFYLSTLGLNASSAMKNMLQLVLTTGPVVGYKTAGEGLLTAMKKSQKYFALRLGKNAMAHEEALRKAFPVFGETGLAASPITDEAIQASLVNAAHISSMNTSGLVKAADKVQRAMMALFTTSENAVRLGTWEAGLLHARRTGLAGPEAIQFAANLTERTQFMSGLHNTPYALIGVTPVLKQLTQFPFRTLEFATSTALTLGSGEKSTVLGLNPGVFARMVAGSVVAMELGSAAGIDVNDALIGGALPTFTEAGKTLSPIPVVPPAVQLMASFAQGIPEGDFTEFQRSMPLLFPGGTAGLRAAGFIPGGRPIAEWAQRNYADYENPGPDGRIPVYTGSGQFRGYFTKWEIVKSGLGVRSGDMQKESELLQMLVKNRDSIREAIRQWVQARLRNDAAACEKIARQFHNQFGFDIPVTQQHVEAVRMRRATSRLEQIVRTLQPGPERQQAMQILSHAFGQEAEAMLGLDPALFDAPKPQRDLRRTGQPKQSTYTGAGRMPYTNRTMTPTGAGMDPAAIGHHYVPQTR